MSIIYLGLGSNIEPEENLSLAVRELRDKYGELEISACYRSAAIGFAGDDFLNLVVGLRSDDRPLKIIDEIERLHNLVGRARSSDKWAARPLDIDLLLYNDEVIEQPPVRVPRSDILEYSFVLRPLAELAPELIHPVSGRTMAAHWQEFDESSHPLERVDAIS